jgi:hypothetical protein
MAKRRKRELTHHQLRIIAKRFEARGDKQEADNIRRLAKERFRAVMT